MAGGITIYMGLAASGKTSALIDDMRRHQGAGGKVALILSCENSELTKRPNVKPGGKMGCRTPGKYFEISHVCDTTEAAAILGRLENGTLAVFDEAQYFRPRIVEAWSHAAERGIRVIAASLSAAQLTMLDGVRHEVREFEINCVCGRRIATRVMYGTDRRFPTHLCDRCYESDFRGELENLFVEVQAAEPFAGRKETYQPFYGVDMPAWRFVRRDCQARLDVVFDAVNRVSSLREKLSASATRPTYLDLGCCSGFFTDGMTTRGFSATGVDITARFISWADRMANLKGQAINYVCSDALKYFESGPGQFDVSSAFATVQWLMAQKGYAAGVECLRSLFERTRYIVVVEMGYTTEEIYRHKIAGLDREIDKDWVLDIMKVHGGFEFIEVHHAGEAGLWRDVFVGFKTRPAARSISCLPEITGAKPASSCLDYWDDRWAGSAFEIYLRSDSRLESIEIKGWRPAMGVGAKARWTLRNIEALVKKWRNESTDRDRDVLIGPAQLSVLINGERIGTFEARAGAFEFRRAISIAPGEIFRLAIRGLPMAQPLGDRRPLSFVLNRLSFEQ